MNQFQLLQFRISRFISGPDETLLENRIFNTASFILFLLSIPALFNSIKSDENHYFFIAAFIASIILFSNFYFARFKGKFKETSKFFIYISVIYTDFIWYITAEESYITNYIFPLILILGLSIIPVREHLKFSILLIVNIFALDLIVFLLPDLMGSSFTAALARDQAKSHTYLVFMIILIALVLSYFKKGYEKEREIARRRFLQIDNSNHSLHNRNEHLESLARMVSHNLRSPIAGIKMLLSLYDRPESPISDKELIVNLKEGIGLLFGMVDDLARLMLDYTELNKEKEIIDLKTIGDHALIQLQGQITHAKAQINIDFSAYPIVIYSKIYLESIFLNLISNALKYRSDERDVVIDIRSYLQNDSVIIEFTDNGIGIDLEKYGHQIFKMYKTFHDIEGVDSKGIGLFITKNQVETLGGKIRVQSEYNKGTSFFIELYRI